MIDYSTKVLSYDADRYPFAAMVAEHFGAPLETLGYGEQIARLEVSKDQQTRFHQHFYAIAPAFLEVYQAFVCDVVFARENAADWLYQRIPTFRVHLPGNVATGGFHKDSDYNHPVEELNFIVALTRMADTNSVWIESAEGTQDYAPITMRPGQYLRFHGATLMHGSHPNTTDQTRCSFDFRILPKSAYKETGLKTVNQGRALVVGDYYADGGEL